MVGVMIFVSADRQSVLLASSRDEKSFCSSIRSKCSSIGSVMPISYVYGGFEIKAFTDFCDQSCICALRVAVHPQLCLISG